MKNSPTAVIFVRERTLNGWAQALGPLGSIFDAIVGDEDVRLFDYRDDDADYLLGASQSGNVRPVLYRLTEDSSDLSTCNDRVSGQE